MPEINSEEFLILPRSTIELLLQQDEPGPLIALYSTIYYHLKFKEQPYYFEEDLCKLLKWDVEVLRFYEKQLGDLNIINKFKVKE